MLDITIPITQPSAHGVEDDQLISHAQKRFYISPMCEEARSRLQALVDNPKYNTDLSYITCNQLPFVDRHLHHLSLYPKTNLDGYISNLKLMTNSKHSRPTS